ncbi:unnamed protein product (macronuclear) [Paramecium tetraurelia]|uniref:Uncharacterized protein n=1 Tax=Paramecium tetraurelia TaxID=5888 RepID=A0BQ63_PARTE|nr:uncharacterized protein GSPATT00005431001 [Paramecium tetraurelia]CAK60680.1 unnamed protein product [Paramecium tetraurelia]|eukprot:XP_001428078.1 hypothetical protein (macronuclear) [Paramecium tetraurelia strain d4-2]
MSHQGKDININDFSSPHLQISKKDQFLEEIRNHILSKSRNDVWRQKGQPNFVTRPYVEWRRGDTCCAIM